MNNYNFDYGNRNGMLNFNDGRQVNDMIKDEYIKYVTNLTEKSIIL